MTKTVQQIAPQQAVPVRTGQGASKPRKDSDEFQSLMQSAVNDAGKDGEKPETGGKSGKTDHREDHGGEETAQNLLQTSLQAPFLPFGTGPAETVQTASLNGLAMTAELPPANDAAADVLQGTAAEPVSPVLPADSQTPVAAVSPVLQQSVPTPPELQTGKTAQEGPPAPPVADVPETVPEESGPEGNSLKAPPVQAKQTVSEKTPVTAESPPVQNGGAVPEEDPQTAMTPEEAKISENQPLPDGKSKARASGGEAQPQKKAEAPDGDGKAGSLSDLYAGGNVVIKVSDAKAAQKPSAASQVAQAVARQVKQGRQEFQMELYPQSLGKVSVKLSAENGVLTVEIAASNPKTQSLLLSGSDDIRSMLQSSTGQNVNVVKPEQSGGWYSQQDGGGSGGNQRQEQEEDKQKESEAWRGVRSVGMNTGSFLSILQLAQ